MDSVFYYRNPEAEGTNGGSLQGLKIAIQPNISAAGWPTDAGSRALNRFIAVEDSTMVSRLRQAGAVLCGSTLMSEFGLGMHNSRAGRAVQQGEAEAELILDLMGESRLAASAAQVYGFKPTSGTISRYGLIGLIPSMESCGVISKSLICVRDILKTMAGQDELDYSLPVEKAPDFAPRRIEPSSLTAGLITESQDSLSTEERHKFQSVLADLKKKGFTVREFSLPDFALFSAVHKIVGSVEASSCAGRYDSVRYGQRSPGAKNWNEMYMSTRAAAFGPLLKSFLFQGAYFQFERYAAYENACRLRARLVGEMQAINKQVDFLVLPAAGYKPSALPLSLAETYSLFNTTVFANVTGQPALYLPADGTGNGGIQLAGLRLNDGLLLSLGEYLVSQNRGGK
ncbi:MAG TPA: amidase family protein [Dehalococcoidales bacterium]|nr:amidase family protein [Dehalococcoidales bacterium]